MSRLDKVNSWLMPGVTVVLAVTFVTGFLSFASMATRDPAQAHAPADAIVVLTGSGARLGEAGRLMRAGFGRRLLVSGVNPKVHREDLERLTGLDGPTLRCCVDVGYAALDTIGNAGEARGWARRHGFRRLIVVTAAYHMPRSLAELTHAMPDVELTPHAVLPRDHAAVSWWSDPGRVRLLASEYVKYLSASARLAAERWIGVDDGARLVDNDGSGKFAHSQ